MYSGMPSFLDSESEEDDFEAVVSIHSNDGSVDSQGEEEEEEEGADENEFSA